MYKGCSLRYNIASFFSFFCRFTITAPGLGKVEVEVELICECECEKGGEANSPKCKNLGTYKCGICYCNPGRYGEICECDEQTQADDSKCKQANSTNPDVVCSNAGSCVCGKCVCNKRDVRTFFVNTRPDIYRIFRIHCCCRVSIAVFRSGLRFFKPRACRRMLFLSGRATQKALFHREIYRKNRQ